jgi:tryptophan synthase alpha chain
MTTTSIQTGGGKTIEQTFADLRGKKQLAFMPFVTAGFPSLDVTERLLPELEKAGANLIEVGFPFSDPIADGPTIQESYTLALQHKIRVADIFKTIAAARPKVSIPMVGMVSYSLIYRYGLDRFCQDAIKAGLRGLILPDLPPPEAQAVCQKVNAAGLKTILLVAPTTTPERRKQIASLCTGFVYYLSISGITGERTSLPSDITQSLENLRSLTDVPICVGFGISKSEHLKQLEGHADGAIVGSAVVRRMKDHAGEGAEAVVKSVLAYCRELLSGTR